MASKGDTAQGGDVAAKGGISVAAPGEPRCPAEGCERPAGFATDHDGDGFCRRHESHRDWPEPTPFPNPEPPGGETVVPATAPAPVADPLARRITGSRATAETSDPLAVLRQVLATARRAGYPFGDAWAIGAEAALSYMTARTARDWWEALTATERAWADAYACEQSRPETLTRG